MSPEHEPPMEEYLREADTCPIDLLAIVRELNPGMTINQEVREMRKELAELCEIAEADDEEIEEIREEVTEKIAATGNNTQMFERGIRVAEIFDLLRKIIQTNRTTKPLLGSIVIPESRDRMARAAVGNYIAGQAVRTFREKGRRISMENFGTIMSSLSQKILEKKTLDS